VVLVRCYTLKKIYSYWVSVDIDCEVNFGGVAVEKHRKPDSGL